MLQHHMLWFGVVRMVVMGLVVCDRGGRHPELQRSYERERLFKIQDIFRSANGITAKVSGRGGRTAQKKNVFLLFFYSINRLFLLHWCACCVISLASDARASVSLLLFSNWARAVSLAGRWRQCAGAAELTLQKTGPCDRGESLVPQWHTFPPLSVYYAV